MRTRFFNFWESIRTSFWFIPALMVVSAIALAAILIAVDRQIELGLYNVFGVSYDVGPQGARSVLSTIAGSSITVAGVAFSITIVALTLTSSQFGPRLLRNFMQDTGNQVVLGTFLATFIYCLLVLRSVNTAGALIFVPSISVTFAVGLALVNVGVLIYFIHHVATSIQADHVIAAVYRELLEHLHRLFPDALEADGETSRRIQDRRRIGDGPGDSEHRVDAEESGYLQAIDLTTLSDVATRNDMVMHVDHRPGNFVLSGSPLARIRYSGEFDRDFAGLIRNAFILGAQRTPEQDPAFSIDQLVEVAVRALSPGINDPFTAMRCIDRLGAALCFLSDRAFPCPYLSDENHRVRVVLKPVTFSDLTNTAFDQIRQYSASSVAVRVRLLETIASVAKRIRRPEPRQALLRQAEMIVETGQRSPLGDKDREQIEACHRTLLQLVNPTQASNTAEDD